MERIWPVTKERENVDYPCKCKYSDIDDDDDHHVLIYIQSYISIICCDTLFLISAAKVFKNVFLLQKQLS